jgi:tetratricopeptide (TPR) repeat protein
MKLDRLDDAIAAARLAVLSGQERGRSLNVLGILLSMKKDREGSLRIFREAIAEELALGTLGQPATPLNNSGEVYEEIFQEDKAEGSWLRATGMPDGCEHVLPTLNLTLLYLEQLNLVGASRALDNFESCIAQYPLRNGEEHRALVELARGRIAFHSGDSAQAISKFESALQHRQWFGKIGTNQDDLYSAGLISLSAALQAQAHSLSIQLTNGVFEEMKKWKRIAEHRVRAWWLMRRARQVLIEDLKNIEDLFIRNTDSLIEYPTFGTVLAGIPSSTLEDRLAREIAQDSRKDAQLYYQAYKGENLLQHGDRQNGTQLLNQVINGARPKYDSLLRLHAIIVSLQKLIPGTEEYVSLAQQAYAISRPSLRNAGYALPVNYAEGDKEILSALKKTGFILDNTRSLQYAVGYYRSQQGIELEFRSTAGGQVAVKVRGADLYEAINKFNEEVFTQDLK